MSCSKISDGSSSQSTSLQDGKELKHEDLLQYSNLFSSEFNKSAMHDRVLVFQVISSEGNEYQEMSRETNYVGSQDEDGTRDRSGEDGQNEMEETLTGQTVPEMAENIKTHIDSTAAKHDVDDHGSSEREGVVCQSNPDEPSKERRVLVHSCWLAVQSPYFKTLFYSGMEESQSKEVVIKVTEGELEGYLTLIEAMYKLDILNEKDYRLVVQVLLLADKHDVNLVFKKCKYVLMDITHDLENCQYIWENVRHLPHCENLCGSLEDFLVNHFAPFDQKWTNEEFVKLSELLVELLLSSDSLLVKSENTVFVSLMRWLEHNNNNPPQSSMLLSVVRFEFLTANFLCDIVDDHPIATQMSGYEQYLHEGLTYHCYSEERQNVMEDKPVKRVAFVAKNTSVFTWIIDKNVRKQLQDPDSESPRASSSMFWFNGYEMFLELVKTKAPSELMGHKFYIYLCVNNITKNAYLKLKWQVNYKPLPTDWNSKKELQCESIFGGDQLSSGISLSSMCYLDLADVSRKASCIMELFILECK